MNIRIAVLSLCLIASLALAQEKSGSLQGSVSDGTNAVLPGVTVTLTNQSTHRTFTETAGPYGDYLIRDVPPGHYSIAFELTGFVRTEFPDIDILVAQNLRLDTKLKPGSPATTIQVTDTAPLMDTQNSTLAYHIPESEFDRLPKDRSFQQLAILAPGVNSGEIEGGIQIHGASGAENAFLIDGIATQSAIDGRSRQNAPFEYIQEIQIQTAGTEADEKGALGGVISAVTRSGGNQLHGNTWLYYSGNALSGTPTQRLVLSPNNNSSVGFFQDAKSKSHSDEPGFSLGGPILKNRVYFFTSWSPRWMQQDQLYHFGSGETGTIRRNQTFMSGFNKLSWEPSPRVRTNFSWLWSPSKGTGSLPAYNDACANCVSSSLASNAVNRQRGYFNPQSSYALSVDVPLSANVILTSRFGYFWDNYKDTGVPDVTSVQYQAPAVGPLVPVSAQGPVGFQNTPAILKFDHDRISRTSGQFDISYFTHFMGTHNIKTGYGIEKTVNETQSGYPGGYVNVWWDQSFTSLATGVQDRGTYGYYEVNDFHLTGTAGSSIKSAYVQDNWRLLPRVTLNAGIRFEDEQIPSFRPDLAQLAGEFHWRDMVAPRIGAAVDVFGTGRLKLSGSWGRFFDPVREDLARQVFGGETWHTYYRSLDTTDVFNFNLSNMPGRDLWNPSTPNSFRDRISAAAGLASVAKDLKPMAQDQWSIGADFQENPRTVSGIHYIHQSLSRAIDDLAVLVNGSASYIFANPGEGAAVSVPFVTGQTAKPLNYPKPVRTYDAVEFTLAKRVATHWFGNFSYTWSRLYGNYSGTASSDELLTPTTGLSYSTAQQLGGSIAHPARNANFGWDLDEILFDSKGHLDTKGRLATDRPNVFKLNGGYDFNFHNMGKTSIGTFVYMGSGTPLSTQVYTLNHIPVFVNGRGDLGRTPFLSHTDLQVAHTVKLHDVQSVRVEMNILNVFNQKTVLHRFTSVNRGDGVPVNSSAIDLSTTDLRKGYDYNALILATPDGANAFDPRFGKNDLFQDGIAARFAVKWSF